MQLCAYIYVPTYTCARVYTQKTSTAPSGCWQRGRRPVQPGPCLHPGRGAALHAALCRQDHRGQVWRRCDEGPHPQGLCWLSGWLAGSPAHAQTAHECQALSRPSPPHTSPLRVGVLPAAGRPACQAGVITDLVLLWTVGIRPVLVHGGGPEINSWLQKLNIEPEFKGGLRVTDGACARVRVLKLRWLVSQSSRLQAQPPNPQKPSWLDRKPTTNTQSTTQPQPHAHNNPNHTQPTPWRSWRWCWAGA